MESSAFMRVVQKLAKKIRRVQSRGKYTKQNKDRKNIKGKWVDAFWAISRCSLSADIRAPGRVPAHWPLLGQWPMWYYSGGAGECWPGDLKTFPIYPPPSQAETEKRWPAWKRPFLHQPAPKIKGPKSPGEFPIRGFKLLIQKDQRPLSLPEFGPFPRSISSDCPVGMWPQIRLAILCKWPPLTANLVNEELK